MAPGKLLYHFTSTFHLPRILADGALRTSESNIGSPHPSLQPFGEHIGPRVVWLTQSHVIGAGGEGLHGSAVDKTRVRFTVDVHDAVPWGEFAASYGINPKWFARLDANGGGMAKAWWVVSRDIPVMEWLEVKDVETGLTLDLMAVFRRSEFGTGRVRRSGRKAGG